MKQRIPEQFLASDCSIVAIAGKQYFVAPGLKIFVDKLEAEVGKEISFSDVILTSTAGKTAIGTPFISGSSVTTKVISQERGDKLRVMRFRSKSNYHRSLGHRQPMTQLEIISL